MLQRENGKRKNGGSHRLWPNIGGRVSSLPRPVAINKLLSLAARAAFNRFLERRIFFTGLCIFRLVSPVILQSPEFAEECSGLLKFGAAGHCTWLLKKGSCETLQLPHGLKDSCLFVPWVDSICAVPRCSLQNSRTTCAERFTNLIRN